MVGLHGQRILSHVALLGKPRRKLSWDDLRARLADVGPPDLTDSGPNAEPGGASPTWVAWHEGPSIATVQAAVGDTPGWQWRAVAPSPEPSVPPPAESPTVWVRRSLSRPALAVALVRFYGAHGRYFTTADERGREKFALICDVDDPVRSGYPIVDLIADELLAADSARFAASAQGDVASGPRPHDIDELSDLLRDLNYERLWAEAYKAVG
jgi:hypothetical protein